MTRVLEVVVALIIVLILAVIVALFLPSHGHISRSIEVSHNPEQIYDMLNNFQRFSTSTGAVLKADDPDVKFELSGPAYGPGAAVAWQGNGAIGSGKLVNKSGNIDITNKSKVVWDLSNDWHGTNKVFTFTVVPRSDQRISTVTWSYDVDYGWNLLGRYSRLWLHGSPEAMIQYGLDSLQTALSMIPNIDYSKVHPAIVKMPATPMLVVPTQAPRQVDDIDNAKAAAMKEIQAAMAKLGVKAAGPTTVIRTQWGDVTFKFAVAVPIDTTTLTVAGQSFDLTKLPPPASGDDPATSAPAASSSAGTPASASSAGAAASAPAPGTVVKPGQLVVDGNVRAMMLPAQETLASTWTGEINVQFMVQALEAYAATHGYDFDEAKAPPYTQLVSLPTVDDADQMFRVFVPLQSAPEQTPDQIAGSAKPFAPLDPSLWAATNAAPKPAETKKEEKGAKKPEARKRPEPARKRHHR